MTINFFTAQSQTLYLAIIIVMLATLTLCRLKGIINTSYSALASHIAAIIYLCRVFGLMAMRLHSDEIYLLASTALAYSFQSLLIGVFFILASQSNITHVLSLQDGRSLKKEISVIIRYINKDSDYLLFIISWNLLFYILLGLPRFAGGLFVQAGNLAFLVATYWLAAYKINNVSSQLVEAEGAQMKLDIVVVCFIMIGLLNLAFPLITANSFQNTDIVLGSLYLFEFVAVMILSEGYSSNWIRKGLGGCFKSVEYKL